MHNGPESAKAIAEFTSITKKVGYASANEALVITSFSLELPESFGLLPNSGVAHDSRVLPALPTFREWDGGDGYNGLKVLLTDRLSEFIPQMGQYYRSMLMGEALTVATEMLLTSKAFISDWPPGSTQRTRTPLPGLCHWTRRPGGSSHTVSV